MRTAHENAQVMVKKVPRRRYTSLIAGIGKYFVTLARSSSRLKSKSEMIKSTSSAGYHLLDMVASLDGLSVVDRCSVLSRTPQREGHRAIWYRTVRPYSPPHS